MNRLKTQFLIACLLILNLHPLQTYAQDFTDTTEALSALGSKNFNISWNAIKYLAAHPKESTPTLMRLVEQKEDRWISAMQALTFTKQEEVILLYIKLLEENVQEKDEFGEIKQYGLGSKHGCVVRPNLYAAVLAEHLGELGNSRAIPVLYKVIKEGDRQVQEKAYGSLYKLGAISLDEMFQIGKDRNDSRGTILEVIMRIGWESIHSENEFAIGLFDRVIREFPQEDFYVASSYFWKIQCYELLQEYERALQACDEALRYPQFENLVEQINRKKEEIAKKIERR
jgi:hypothetical protein